MTRRYPAAGCGKPITSRFLAYHQHWLALPKELRRRIWDHVPQNGRASPAYLAAAREALTILNSAPR